MLEFLTHLALTLLSGVLGYVLVFITMYLLATSIDYVTKKQTGMYSDITGALGLITVCLLAPLGAVIGAVTYIIAIFI